MGNTSDLLHEVLQRLERILPNLAPASLHANCYRWQRAAFGISHLVPLDAWQPPVLGQLCGIDEEIAQLRANTNAFVNGKPANHALLTGPRGCGKTTIVHGIAGEFALKHNLVVVRLAHELFAELPQLAATVANKQKKLLVICDELSFPVDGSGHLAAKAALDDLEASSTKLLVYATSNRRHLLVQSFADNLAAITGNGEIHPEETNEEKISLSDRFGLWLPFAEADEEHYFSMVQCQLTFLEQTPADAKELRAARQWADERGSLNGRIAGQFARYLASTRA